MEQGHYKDAIRIIKSHQVDGQAIVAYLQRKGFEDIALHFVQEPRARFNLAIRCGNLEVFDGLLLLFIRLRWILLIFWMSRPSGTVWPPKLFVKAIIRLLKCATRRPSPLISYPSSIC